MNVDKIREDFPFLRRNIIYLDNAATTQKPAQVISAIEDYYRNHNANIHRAVHTLSAEATEMHESARKRVASFVGADRKEIIFTRNATESINVVSHSLGWKKGDEVVSTVMEHHSNIVPWQMLRPSVKTSFADIHDDGTLDMESMESLITKKTRLVTVAQASNVLGTVSDIRKISKMAHDAGALLLVDASQSVPHMGVDVSAADFMVFSGHKMLGPMGIGVLYGRRQLLENMSPFMGGGDMIKEVTLKETTYNDLPYKFEAGTPNVAGAVGLSAAIDYLEEVGMKNISAHEERLTKHCIQKLEEIKGLTLLGRPKNRIGVVPFAMKGIHSHDVASIVNEDGVAIRSGHHCAMPLLARLGISDACRASFYLYNTQAEIDALAESLKKAKAIFKV